MKVSCDDYPRYCVFCGDRLHISLGEFNHGTRQKCSCGVSYEHTKNTLVETYWYSLETVIGDNTIVIHHERLEYGECPVHGTVLSGGVCETCGINWDKDESLHNLIFASSSFVEEARQRDGRS